MDGHTSTEREKRLEEIKPFVETAAVADLTAAQTLIEAKLTRRSETLKALKTRPHTGVSDDPQ